MKTPQEILDEFQTRAQEFLDVKEHWRETEVIDGFGVYDGSGQWLQEDYDKQVKDGMPVVTINKASPVIDAVSGFQIQNRFTATYQPRQIGDEGDEEQVNIVQNTVEYIEEDSGIPHEDSIAFRDMTICGVGATNHDIEYEEDNVNGDAKGWRIFPYLLLFDIAARGKNLRDANWCAEAKIISSHTAEQEIADANGDDDALVAASATDHRFLEYFDNTQLEGKLAVAFDYQWRDKEIIWRARNPFLDYQGGDPLLDNYLADAIERFDFTTEDTLLVLTSQQKTEFAEELEALGIELKAKKQRRFRYYRARIIGNTIVEITDSLSQKGFSIKLMTGKFDEKNQCHYGMMRAIKEAQRLLNLAVSDYQGFLTTIPKGGVEMEYDAVDDLNAFRDTYTKAKDIVIYAEGGLNKTRPKQTPPVPDGLMGMIDFAINSIMEVVGVTPSFMGEMDSKELTGKLQAQLVRTGLSVLALYFDAFRFYIHDRGKLMIDIVRVLADNDDGRLVRNVIGKGNEKYLRLLKEDISSEYDIIVGEAPQTPNERQETFEKLMELTAMLAPKGIDLTSIAIPFSPLKKDERDAVMELMKPQPEPEPDPLQQGLLQAEIGLKQGISAKNQAESSLKKLEVLLKIKELGEMDERIEAEIEEIKSKALLNIARAGDEVNR